GIRIAREAVLLASLFQQLGYFGRCSFDTILVGPDPATAEVHWAECNGRGGGTSIPMTLVNRLTGDWAETPLAVVVPEEPVPDRHPHRARARPARIAVPAARLLRPLQLRYDPGRPGPGHGGGPLGRMQRALGRHLDPDDAGQPADGRLGRDAVRGRRPRRARP